MSVMHLNPNTGQVGGTGGQFVTTLPAIPETLDPIYKDLFEKYGVLPQNLPAGVASYAQKTAQANSLNPQQEKLTDDSDPKSLANIISSRINESRAGISGAFQHARDVGSRTLLDKAAKRRRGLVSEQAATGRLRSGVGAQVLSEFDSSTQMSLSDLIANLSSQEALKQVELDMEIRKSIEENERFREQMDMERSKISQGRDLTLAQMLQNSEDQRQANIFASNTGRDQAAAYLKANERTTTDKILQGINTAIQFIPAFASLKGAASQIKPTPKTSPTYSGGNLGRFS